MPRAAIPERLQVRQRAQQVAVVQREAASAEAVLTEQVETVAGGVPADLAVQLDDIRTRLDALDAS